MSSIKDIAKKAGVSISTVSYALNGSPKVTEATRKKIMTIAKELDYVPNAAARSLKTRKTKIVGAFLTNYSGAFYGQLLKGMGDALSDQGYELIVCSGVKSHRLLSEGMIDGAIILDAFTTNEDLLNYAERGHKIVVLDRELRHKNISSVLLDNITGANLAMNYLHENGNQKIYVVKGPEDSYDAKQRLQAVREFKKNKKPVEYIEIDGDFNKSSGVRAAKQIINEYTTPVSVFCMNDEMAIGMYDYISKTNYQIGKQIHIIGFDNIDLAGYLQPRLATISYSKYNWGYMGSEQLLQLINKKPVKQKRVSVGIIEGESVQKN
ncbi:LacI family DNA-binding transcriptional regulator [Bacillaceae bacterium Marseille-Q3522]|nr:LacI family DNA-binding transcriptional regulator [Bacillaceae bacterium Marseille-Q3522]